MYNPELLIKTLETKLNTGADLATPYHKDSIMEYGKICKHDSGYLCEHRLEWILKFCKKKFLFIK